MLAMTDTKLIEALSNASSLELFELSNIIDRLLADPRRIVAVRNRLNLGKSVRFMDWRTGEMRAGKVMAIKGDQVTVHEDGTRTQWKLSYAGIDPGQHDEQALKRLAEDADIVHRVRDRVALERLWEVCQTPDFRKKMDDIGAEPIGNSPEQMARQIREETDKFSKLVKDAKVVIE